MLTGMRRAAEVLASGLAARLAAVVPNGIEVGNDEGTVWVSDGAWRSEKELDGILVLSATMIADPIDAINEDEVGAPPCGAKGASGVVSGPGRAKLTRK